MWYTKIVRRCFEMDDRTKAPSSCQPLSGTVLRIFIPAGAVINLLNLIELSSPSGICIILRLPFLSKKHSKYDFSSLLDSIRQAGGKVEFGE